MKTREREEARRLRREEGRSIREIEELLGVARSTASLWVRDIPLTVAHGGSTDGTHASQSRLQRSVQGRCDERGAGSLPPPRLPRARPLASEEARRSLRRRLHALLGGRRQGTIRS